MSPETYLQSLPMSHVLDTYETWTLLRYTHTADDVSKYSPQEWITACRHVIVERCPDPAVVRLLSQ